MTKIRNKQYDITARQTIQTVPIIVRQKQSTAIVSSSIGGTTSFYNDDETAHDNVFTAGLVDFVLTDTPFASAASTTDWTVDVTPHEASNPFYYYASSTDLMGNSELCNALTVTATLAYS